MLVTYRRITSSRPESRRPSTMSDWRDSNNSADEWDKHPPFKRSSRQTTATTSLRKQSRAVEGVLSLGFHAAHLAPWLAQAWSPVKAEECILTGSCVPGEPSEACRCKPSRYRRVARLHSFLLSLFKCFRLFFFPFKFSTKNFTGKHPNHQGSHPLTGRSQDGLPSPSSTSHCAVPLSYHSFPESPAQGDSNMIALPIPKDSLRYSSVCSNKHE